MTDRKIDLPEGVPPLTTYYVYLTGGCNLACKHCWITPTFHPNGGTGGHLDFELFKLAIEEGLPLGLQSVKLTGGEPLLHPDFIKFVDLIRENELGLTIETNGTLMTPELARYLKEKSTLRHISVSLDGAKSETHDPFRGVKGSFLKACQGIRALVDVGYHPQVIMSLHEGNIDDIESLLRLAEQMGAGSVKFNLVQPSGRGEQLAKKGKAITISQLISIGNWVEKTLQPEAQLQLHYSWPIAFYSKDRLLKNGSETCSIFTILGLLSSGHMAMCGVGAHLEDLCYGKLGEDSIKETWISHPKLNELRRNVPANLKGICGKCIFKNSCLGSCIANNYHLSGELTSSFWFCQQASENRLFPITRQLDYTEDFTTGEYHEISKTAFA